MVIRWSSDGLQVVIRTSSAGHQVAHRWSSAGHQLVIRQSSGGHEVIRWSSGGHQVVIGWSSDILKIIYFLKIGNTLETGNKKQDKETTCWAFHDSFAFTTRNETYNLFFLSFCCFYEILFSRKCAFFLMHLCNITLTFSWTLELVSEV